MENNKSGKNVTGRTKTDIHKKAMIEALKKTLGVVTHALKIANVSRSQFYEWLRIDPEFKKEVDTVKDIALDFVESKLFKQIEDNNTTATIFYLKTKGKKRGYIERQELEVEGKFDARFTNVPDEDLLDTINELKKLAEKFK